MLGLYTIGTRPLGSFNRKTVGAVSAILAVASAASMASSAIALAPAVVTFAGNGAATFLNGVGSAVMSASGAGVLNIVSIVRGNMAVVAAGSGAASPVLSSTSRASVSSSGLGTFIPVMIAKIPAASSMQGAGAFNGSNVPGYDVFFSGSGTLAAVSYAFYGDVEKAGPAYEVRTAQALSENRIAVAPSEDRVYYARSKGASTGPPNRRRIL